MNKVYLYANYATLVGFNNLVMFQCKMLNGSLRSFAEICAEESVLEYGALKNFSVEAVLMDESLKEIKIV